MSDPTNETAAFPEGVTDRYLTVGGATVDITQADDGLNLYVHCNGCDAEHETRSIRTYHAKAKANTWAQDHADRCRAMPKPVAVVDYEDLLGTIALHVDWRRTTRHLTTEQRELFADAVENWKRRLNEGYPNEDVTVDRWWRDDATG